MNELWRSAIRSHLGPLCLASYDLSTGVLATNFPAELQAAIADDVLTIDELSALPSLIRGESTFYTETLHPMQSAQQPEINVVASGLLEDGRSFTYHINETHTLRQVKIELE